MDNPQDLINQALGGNTPATPSEPATPTLPTPEPLESATPTTPTPPVSDTTTNSSPEPTTLATTDAVVPTELTSDSSNTTLIRSTNSETMTNTETTPSKELGVEAKGEDVPLALVGAVPMTADATTVSTPVVEPIAPSVQPALDQTPSTSDSQKPKKKVGKILAMMVGFLSLIGLLSYIGYNNYGYVLEPAKIANVGDCPDTIKWCREPDGDVVKNPNYDPDNPDNYNAPDDDPDAGVKPGEATKDTCNGCSNGGWLVWRNGECKVTGICDSGVPGKDTDNPNVEAADTASDCQKVGGTWCSATDLNGTAYAFCNGTSGSGVKTCNTLAAEKGYVILTGSVKCKCADTACTSWIADHDKIDYYWDGGNGEPVDLDKLNAEKTAVTNQCATQYANAGKVGFGEGSFICKIGKVGSGGEVYNGGQCTSRNGFPYNGGSCFCGTVQVDSTNGHISMTSTCGCDNEVTNNPSPSPSAGAPSFMCNTLTRTPTTAPAIGTTYTFTCAGSAAPTGSVNLTYKFRYSRNDGAYTALTNKTATTAEMTVAQCGRYKVQCQACGTINGVLSCDPVWTPATTQ